MFLNDQAFMTRALELASKGEGAVNPNPLVGAVVVVESQIVGEGWHQRFGGPHAEVNALDEAGAASNGATLYVTLEHPAVIMERLLLAPSESSNQGSAKSSLPHVTPILQSMARG